MNDKYENYIHTIQHYNKLQRKCFKDSRFYHILNPIVCGEDSDVIEQRHNLSSKAITFMFEDTIDGIEFILKEGKNIKDKHQFYINVCSFQDTLRKVRGGRLLH